MPVRPLSVILVVICTMAGVVALYALTLAIMCTRRSPSEVEMKALDQFKDFGIFAAGALSGFLARTSTHDSPAVPTKTEIVNDTAHPVPTDPQT